ncbi:MAG: hypothetical protein ACD_2C00181G0009 [uncultured bacterium (gcode 4)]|uniref:Protein translocase subunit SecD n=1 Tax=uncultured bacterium (gcode 4) TaxID=1234023 RepID=K2FE27_9BACT|nr:MAG: hypothetical protein ACD_2C00181G0009 [uncultured bacterium (gcode 4)]
MKGLWLKIALIFLIMVWTFYVSFPWGYFGLNLPYTGEYKLWLDLQGWVELDYRIDLEEAKKKWDYNESTVVEWLKSIIEKRVNSLGTAEPTIFTAKYGNESHIVVQIPASNYEGQNLTKEQISEKNNEYIAKAKETIGKVVRLEFKEKKVQITEADKAERKQIAESIKKDLDSKEFDFTTVANKYKDQYENATYTSWSWAKDELPLEATFTWMEEVQAPFISDILETQKQWGYILWENGALSQGEAEKGFSLVKINSVIKQEKEKDVVDWTWATAKTRKEKYTATIFDYQVIFVSQKPSEWMAAKTEKWEVLDERFLTKASANMNQGFQPQVELTFNAQWAKIFAELTKRLLNKQLAIYVWWEQLTAPTIQSVIPDGKAVITGSYTIDTAKKLANDINTWIVPAPIYLTSERAIDAKIWWDSLIVIWKAGIIGFLLILTFLISVYRLWGLLAWIALLGYIMITLTLVKLFWVVLSLASIAGLILSVWLAIDANILIFERSKEELSNHNEVIKSLNVGFDRSWTAIWDSHVTSFVSAVILYMIWVNLIKWFWLMLWIWLVVSLFSAMWISHVLIMALAPKFSNNLKLFIGINKK